MEVYAASDGYVLQLSKGLSEYARCAASTRVVNDYELTLTIVSTS